MRETGAVVFLWLYLQPGRLGGSVWVLVHVFGHWDQGSMAVLKEKLLKGFGSQKNLLKHVSAFCYRLQWAHEDPNEILKGSD